MPALLESTIIRALEFHPASERRDVVSLSHDEMCAMPHDDLVEAILATRPCPVPDELAERLQFYDRDTLLRLAHLARRNCRCRD